MENNSKLDCIEKKNSVSNKQCSVKSPSKKKPKILDKSLTIEEKINERSLSLRNRSKEKLSSSTDDGNNLFVAIKTDPFAPTSILETQNINDDQALGITSIGV